MGRYTLKAALLGLASVLMASSSLFAALLDDHEDGTNNNEFEAYWYYYDDNAGLGIDDRPLAAPSSNPSVINVEFTPGPREAYGDPSDTWEVKDYTFTCGEEAGNKYATMPFTFGDVWTASYGDAMPYVGLGTMLADEGKTLDLTGATSVKFKIRSHAGPLAIDFKIQTLDIDQDSSFGYYQKSVSVTTDWTEVEVLLADLKQPAWATGVKKFDFDITKCTKLAWEVQNEDNTTTTVDTLDVDDISIEPFTFVSTTVWTETKALSPLPTTGQFAKFETAPKNVCPLNFYWYAYNDKAIGGGAEVTGGATENLETGLLNLTLTEGTGSPGETGTAAFLQYTLGPVIDKAGVSVQSFVGIGVNLYDSAAATYWNATTDNVSSIYFQYMADGDAKYVTLELSDINDVADKDHPDKADSDRGAGIVWYRNLLPTDGQWVAVEIPFSQLITHDTWEGYNAIPLDATKLAKLQFKVQGAQDAGGYFAIDNVFFPGAPFDVAVKDFKVASSKLSGISAIYRNGKVNVSWNGNGALDNGKINLINTAGAVVASSSFARTGKLSTSFSTAKLSAGMYFVKLNAIGANGKAVVMQSPVHIVK